MTANERRPDTSTWALIERTADHIWESGLAKSYRFENKSAIVLVLMKGWELGLPLMSSLEHIRVIHGRFSLSAEAAQAIVLARVEGAKFTWVADGKGGVAEVTASRPGHASVTVRFTHDDATKTGLAQKNPIYQSFPGNLLRAAAIRGAVKRLFPDVLLGLEAPEDDEEQVTEQLSKLRQEVVPVPTTVVQFKKPMAGTTEWAPAPAPSAPAAPSAQPSPPATRVAERSAPPADDAPASTRVDQIHQAASQAGLDIENSGLVGSIPEDSRLPFSEGQWAGVCLSDLKAEDFPKMFRGFTARLNKAREENDDRKIRANTEWLDRCKAWAAYRGVEG